MVVVVVVFAIVVAPGAVGIGRETAPFSPARRLFLRLSIMTKAHIAKTGAYVAETG